MPRSATEPTAIVGWAADRGFGRNLLVMLATMLMAEAVMLAMGFTWLALLIGVDAAWQFGGLWISVWHPMLMGRLARAAALAELIAYMQAKGGVWFARLEEIAAHVKKTIDDGLWKPRIDRLPYYPGPIPELPRKPK